MGAGVVEAKFSIDVETGHDLVTCEINSGDLKEITIDTYSTFEIGGNTFEENEIEWMEESSGVEGLTYDDFGWTYNNALWKQYLSEALIRYILEEQPIDGNDTIVKDIELVDTWSPREYNFTTDRMIANWIVDDTLLREWWAKSGFTFEAEMADGGRHGSRDGYHSFITSRYREDPVAIETMMMLDRWIESWSKWESFLHFMWDNISGNGEDQDCIDVKPNSNAALLAWVLCNRDVQDEWIADFAAKQVRWDSLRVGDRVVGSFEHAQTVTEAQMVPSIVEGRDPYWAVSMKYYDGSGGRQMSRENDYMVFRAFDPARDL
ncbi:hypothetical protein GS982_01490 [Rhodococcus hoagii]|uniref:Uncharacterized protein n=1 Tax=Rhodococcus hoagii TaxID=43767 RepID=A0A9Q4ZIQ0_RHOHA|nr:hypothetical protein [Prescottella equi]NKT77271.1 hypothetical protein [Prescottella equi]NKZ81057.1 hypothetical protein [Prescottella equi]